MNKKPLRISDAIEEVMKAIGDNPCTEDQRRGAINWFLAGAIWVTTNNMDKRKKPFPAARKRDKQQNSNL